MEMNALINLGLTTAIGGLGWWIKAQHAELGRVQILLNKTREEMAKEYVTKQELKDDMTRVFDTLDKIEEKLDKLFEVK